MQAGLSGTFEKNTYINYGGWGRNSVQFQAFQRNPTDPVVDENGDYYEIERDFDYYTPSPLSTKFKMKGCQTFFWFY